MSARGNHLISGTGRAHGGYHSGTPLAHSTFSRSQMGSLWNHSLERYLFPALSVLDSQAAQEILADRGVLHPRGKSWDSGEVNDPIWLPGIHRIGHGTVPSTCCLAQNPTRVRFIISRRLSNKVSSGHLHHLLPQASSSWAKRTEAWGPASTTEPWTHRLWSCRIHFPWSQPPSRNSVEPTSFPSWTCGARITSFASGRAMSGRRHSSHPQATTNIGSCRMAYPTHHPSSKVSWTKCSGSSSISSWLAIDWPSS